ncbi:MAG: hypothetical protein EBR34_13115 [Sphingomonadaceae bacterium]|nr:hypothetical protein [Sphingomonadaceae bacterium]
MPNPIPTHTKGYSVGYGKPPQGSRFRPGQSGNPKGRPRRLERNSDLAEHISPSLAAVARVLEKKVRIKSGGRLKEMSGLQAMAEVMLEHALYGDARFMRMLLGLNSELEDAARRKKAATNSDTFEWVVQIADELRRAKGVSVDKAAQGNAAIDLSQSPQVDSSGESKEGWHSQADLSLADDPDFDVVGSRQKAELAVLPQGLKSAKGTVRSSSEPTSTESHRSEEDGGGPSEMAASRPSQAIIGDLDAATRTKDVLRPKRSRWSNEPLIAETRLISSHGWGIAQSP